MTTTYARQGVDAVNSDPVSRYTTSNITQFTVGVDSSDSNKYKINRGNTLADVSDFEIDVNGDVSIKNKLSINELSVTGDLTIPGNLKVDGTTTFVNSVVTTIEDMCVQLAVADSVIVSIVDSASGTVTTSKSHGYNNSDYVLVQGVEVSGGFSAEAHNAGVQAPKTWVYRNAKDAWEANVGIDLLNSDDKITISGVDKITNSLVGTVAANFSNVHSAGVSSAAALELSGATGVSVVSTGGALLMDGTGQTATINSAALNVNTSSVVAINSDATVAVTTNGGVSEQIVLTNTQGTAAAAVKIDAVAGGVSVDCATGSSIRFNASQKDSDFCVATGASTNAFFVDGGNDNVGINTGTPNASYKLDVGGDVQAVDIVTTSDQRYKNFIEPVNERYDLDKLFAPSGLRGVIFQWKEVEGKSLGVFAQEVEQFVPEVVNTDTNGYKAVNYEKFAGLFIEKFKQMQAKEKSLEERLEKLEQALLNM